MEIMCSNSLFESVRYSPKIIFTIQDLDAKYYDEVSLRADTYANVIEELYDKNYRNEPFTNMKKYVESLLTLSASSLESADTK